MARVCKYFNPFFGIHLLRFHKILLPNFSLLHIMVFTVEWYRDNPPPPQKKMKTSLPVFTTKKSFLRAPLHYNMYCAKGLVHLAV